MRVCLPPADGQHPAIKPPIWSVLVYMLLVETLDFDDQTVEEGLGLVVPAVPDVPDVPVEGPPPSDLGLQTDAQGIGRAARPARMREKAECEYHSSALTEVGIFFFVFVPLC